jgi:hypothetical protein
MSLLYWYLSLNFFCRSNEHSHVKTNMVHTLHRIKRVDSLTLESLKDMLTEEEYRKCATSPHIEKTWYKMTSDVFVAFLFRVIFLLSHFFPLIHHCQGSCLAFILMLSPIWHFQQEIAEASNDAAKKYYEETPKEDRNDATITAIMKHAARSKQQSFKFQFAKYLAIANPKFGDKFLQEVSSSFQNPLQCIFIQCWLMNNIPYSSYRSRSTGATTRSLRWLLRSYSSLQQLLLLHLLRSDGLSNGTQAPTLVKLSTSLLRDSLTRSSNHG